MHIKKLLLSSSLIVALSYSLIHSSSHTLSFKTLDELPKDNFCNSPLTLDTAIYLLYLGSDGVTNSEIQKLIHTRSTSNEAADKQRKCLQELSYINHNKKHERFLSKLCLWLPAAHQALPSFSFSIQQNFGATIETLPLQTTSATHTVQDWIKKQSDLLHPPFTNSYQLQATNKMLLTTVSVPEFEWKHSFPKKNTYRAPFYLSDRNSYTHIDTMNRTGTYHISETEHFKAIDVPLKQDHLHCYFILNKGDSTKALDSQAFQDLLRSCKWRNIDFYLPKFAIKSSLSQKKMLMTHGMTRAFLSTADFSKIDGKQNLQLLDVQQNSLFITNEIGICCTNSLFNLSKEASNLNKDTPTVFRLNRPFTFLVYDKKNKQILSLGKLTNPASLKKEL